MACGAGGPEDSCGHSWRLCCISTCQGPCLNPGVHQDNVGSPVCAAWGQQHPKGEMHLPAREGSQPCACPGMVSLCTQKGSLLPCTHWSPLETRRPLPPRKTYGPDRSPDTPCYKHFWGIHRGCPEILLLSPTCLCQVLDLRGSTRRRCRIQPRECRVPQGGGAGWTRQTAKWPQPWSKGRGSG